jgi:hypothetical protein
LVLAAVRGAGALPENPVFPLPTLEPIPTAVAGLETPVLDLSGPWKKSLTPPEGFWRADFDSSGWADVAVPENPDPRQPRAALPYAYRRRIMVPGAFSGHRIILRFDGVSNQAQVWVNGRAARQHWGTFMAWTCDVTGLVTPGAEAWLAVAVDDRPLGLAQFVRPGGIMRPVELYAVPPDHLTRLQAETDFDRQYRDATLHLRLTMSFAATDRARVRITLRDPVGREVPLSPAEVALTRGDPDRLLSFAVPAPQQWDAEHPNLYRLAAAVLGPDQQATESLERGIGFRQVTVIGNRMLVNGREVKLRGVWGNSSVAELKRLNVNQSRQKYVTPSFLDDADRLGLYVLDEVPVDFAKYGVETDARYAGQWLSLIADEMERDRSHPSVVIWGLGNESFHGANVLKTFHFVQAEDRQRPAMFSWANRVPVGDELPYSIYSSHYPNLGDPTLDLGDYDVAKWHSPSLVRERRPRPVMPVLHDEYAHVILNEAVIARDPNVRNFWGESIARFWEKMFVTPGALGGDQFGLGLHLGRGNLPGGPEYYLLREAYSPIRIANQPLGNPGPGRPLVVPVKNWYDHTNLDELRFTWSVGGAQGELAGPDVPPHASGELTLPARDWKDDDTVRLQAVEPSGNLANEFLLRLKPPRPNLPEARGPAPLLEERPAEFVVTGRNFRVVFDRYRGLVKSAEVAGDQVLTDGPFLTLAGSGLAYGEWWCDSIRAHSEENEVVVDIRGNYAVIAASFQVRIDGTGLVTTHYRIDHVPGAPPPPTFSPWNATSVGGFGEVGVSYMLPPAANRLAWDRQALWSTYPADHVGRPKGDARRSPPPGPPASWSEREDPPGAGTNAWRGMKENILSASAWVEGAKGSVTALSDGSASVRLAVDPGYRALQGGVRILIDNDWNYEDFGLGNYTRPPLLIRDGYANTVYLRLTRRP